MILFQMLALGLTLPLSQEPTGTPIRDVRRHRIGVAFELGAAPDGLRVSRVEPGEPGAIAGLLAGDVVLQVSGVDAATITSSDLIEHFSRSDPIEVRFRRDAEVRTTQIRPRPAPLAEREVAGAPLDPAHRVPIFEASLGGRAMRFLLHTGTRVSSLTPDAFEALGQQVPGEGERVDVGPLRIGHLEFTGRTFAAGLPVTPGLNYDGVVALPDLAPFLVRIEYGDDHLIVESGSLPAADGEEVLDYFVCKDTGPAVTIEVAGHALDFHLDSSSPTGFAMDEAYTSLLPTVSTPAEIGRVRTSDATHAMLGAKLAGDARIGRHRIAGPAIRFSGAFEHSNLGPDALEEFAVTFDAANRRVRFQRRSGFLETLLLGAAATPPLGDEGPSLRAAFEADRGRPRLLLLLSPT